MDDQNKNLILATVLSFLVILIWFTLFPPRSTWAATVRDILTSRLSTCRNEFPSIT